MADLIIYEDCLQALADFNSAGLNPAQLVKLPGLIAAASRLIRDYCNRRFTRQVLDEVYTVEPWGSLVLNESPVNTVLRLAGSPTTVLTIRQTDAATNQRATVRLTTAGTADEGLVVTGLQLARVASGVTVVQVVDLTLCPTLASVARAVAALGDGWQATPASGYELWATSDLRAPQGAMPAMGNKSAGFVVHVEDLGFELDETLGIIRFDSVSNGDPWGSPSWGSGWATEFGDTTVRGRNRGIRVVYDAGFDVVPESVQHATVELVKAMLERLQTDSTLASESDGTYSWAGRAMVDALPDSVLQVLFAYRNTRA